MGVSRGFWDVLRPVARMESLDSLRGKVLAIDLSFWMIQLLTRVKGINLRKPHIRLLFFRTIHLVARIGAFPVFVTDGEPPPLKLQVRLNRFSRISGVPVNTFVGASNSKVARSSLFTDSVEECVELLELLGMPVLRAKHEAEGLCAELQKQGLVNACVTPDSDAFLYGAELVIKVLQADLKDPRVESYKMTDIESFLGLQREHLVALALLAGCDYNVSGVPGIGCQNAVRLIKAVPKDQMFDRLREWGKGNYDSEPGENGGLRVDHAECERLGEEGKKTMAKIEPHCSRCGHPGSKTSHAKDGCEGCKAYDSLSYASNQEGCRPKTRGFKCTCQYCTQKEATKKKKKLEGWKMKVCRKIFETKGFPNEEIIGIFMHPEHVTLSGDAKPPLVWRSPCIQALEEFLGNHLRWHKAYVRRKLLPLLSFNCLKDTATIRDLGTPGRTKPRINGIYVPHSIQRIKILCSKPLYRLRWCMADTGEDWLCLKSPSLSQDTKVEDDLDIMDSNFQTESLDNHLLFTTDEDMLLVKDAYPDLVSRFEHEQAMRKSRRKGDQRKKTMADDLSGKQLRITSFFQSRKPGACGNATKEVSGMAAQEPRMKVETLTREDAVATGQVGSTFIKQEMSEWEVTRAGNVCMGGTFMKQEMSEWDVTGATHVGIAHGDGLVMSEALGEYPSESEYQLKASVGIQTEWDVTGATHIGIAHGDGLVMSEAHGECLSESEYQLKASVGIQTEWDNNMRQNCCLKPGVVVIEGTADNGYACSDDLEAGIVYPYKAHKLGNNSSPGVQLGRHRILSDMKLTPQGSLMEVFDVDTITPSWCWSDRMEGEVHDCLKMRSRTQRALFN